MSNMSIIFSVLFTMAMVLMIAPSVIALNRGKMLRNIAIWLAIFLGLGLVYQNFGPGSPTALFGSPALVPPPTNNQNINANPDNDNNDDTSKGDQGYSPPKD